MATMDISKKVKTILAEFAKHLEQHHQNLQTAFLSVDTNRNGWISKEELVSVFNVFNFPISQEETEYLVDSFDFNKDGKVSYIEFCNAMTNGPWAPLKVQELKIERPRVKEDPRPKKTVDPATATVKRIMLQLNKHLEQYNENLKDAFLALDADRKGWLSKSEFTAVFNAFNFPVSSQELDLLIDAFDSNKDGKVSYLEFCNTMVNGPWAPMQFKEPPITDPKVPVKYTVPENELKLKLLLQSLHRALEQRFQTVQEAFIHLDTNRSGFISAQELISVLHNNNVRVSWDDIQLLVDYFDTNNDGLVSWEEFVKGIQMNRWNPRGAGDSKKTLPPKPSRTPGTCALDPASNVLNQLHQELRKFTSSRFDTNKDAFLALNTSRSGAITRNEFGLALAKASDVKLTAELVDQLFGLYDSNNDGLVQFTEFVKAMNKSQVQ